MPRQVRIDLPSRVVSLLGPGGCAALVVVFNSSMLPHPARGAGGEQVLNHTFAYALKERQVTQMWTAIMGCDPTLRP